MDLGDLYNQVQEAMYKADAADYHNRVVASSSEDVTTQEDLKNVVPQITSQRYVKDLTIEELAEMIRYIVRQELSSIPYHGPIYGPLRPKYPWENEVIC